MLANHDSSDWNMKYNIFNEINEIKIDSCWKIRDVIDIRQKGVACYHSYSVTSPGAACWLASGWEWQWVIYSWEICGRDGRSYCSLARLTSTRSTKASGAFCRRKSRPSPIRAWSCSRFASWRRERHWMWPTSPGLGRAWALPVETVVVTDDGYVEWTACEITWLNVPGH